MTDTQLENKVFIAFYSQPYEGGDVMGVYSTMEKAQAVIDEKKAKCGWYDYEVLTFTVDQ